jgi:hypothetical protein
VNVPSLYSKRGEYRAYKYKTVTREEALRRLMERDAEIQYGRFLSKTCQEDLHIGGWHYPEMSGVPEPVRYDARAACNARELEEEFEQLLDGRRNGVGYGWPLTGAWLVPVTRGMAYRRWRHGEKKPPGGPSG